MCADQRPNRPAGAWLLQVGLSELNKGQNSIKSSAVLKLKCTGLALGAHMGLAAAWRARSATAARAEGAQPPDQVRPKQGMEDSPTSQKKQKKNITFRMLLSD